MADSALVIAAAAGDRRALDALLSEHLPLVYNVVGRALDGHPDVDDVVQETMLRAVQGLPRLRDPERFRSWLIAIAIRQLQDRARRLGRGEGALLAQHRSLDEVEDVVDPAAGDFIEATNDRLGLATQRREMLEASCWMSPADQRILALWWQEAAGMLSRAEVAEALALTPPHTAVRIQRMKAQLDLARTLLRAWRASPRCALLTQAATGWDHHADPRWLKRLSRHVRDCAQCGLAGQGALPSEVLGIGMLVPPPGLIAAVPVAAAAHSWLGHLVAGFVRRTLDLVGLKSTIALGAGAASIAAVVTFTVTDSTVDPVALPPPPTSIAAAAPSAVPTTNPPRPSPTPVAVLPAAASPIFVAPGGDDTNPGTRERPYASLAKAASVVYPGQTIVMRGGEYIATEPVVLKTNATAAAPITVTNETGEHPIIDAAGIRADAWYITQTATYWTVQGLEIRNSPSHAYVCLSCQHDTFRGLSIHDSGDTGLTLRGPGTIGNLVTDSDFFHNHDTVDHGGSADGLSIKSGAGANNIVRNCRLFENSGDGLDLTAFTDPVTVTSVWAYGNGVNRWNISDFTGPGNGIKLGGGTPAPAVNHVVVHSAAWDNAGYGFTEAGNNGVLTLDNDTAYRNGGTGFAFFGSSSVLRHNLALANGTDVAVGDQVDDQDNSWNEAGWNTTVLRSGDPTTAQAQRSADGSLPSTTFLLNRKDATIGASMRAA